MAIGLRRMHSSVGREIAGMHFLSTGKLGVNRLKITDAGVERLSTVENGDYPGRVVREIRAKFGVMGPGGSDRPART